MLSTKLKEAAGNSADATLYVDDVFSTYLYTGNGSTQTITNGIDLAGKGGMVWIKNRSLGTTAEGNRLVDSLNSGRTFGWTNISESTNGRFDGTVNPFLSNGFTLDSTYGTQGYLTTGSNYASWTFRKAAKFFDVQTVSHTNGTANTIDLSTLATVGMVIAKITTTTGDWTVWQRGLTAGNNLQLNLTNAQSTTNAWLSVSGTTATLAAAAPTGTYVIYAYAHDTSSTGIIQCGSFVSNIANGTFPTVNLGWEPQWILWKSATTGNAWFMADTTRGWDVNGNSQQLSPNSSNPESADTAFARPTATGFTGGSGAYGATYIYMAIRRPNKPPTSGTQVYNAIARTGTGAAATVTGVGFAPDTVMFADRLRNSSNFTMISDRLRGTTDGTSGSSRLLKTNDTGAELVDSSFLDNIRSLTMDGFNVGSDYLQYINKSGLAYINHAFKRAPGFFDVVCYTGAVGYQDLSHNLGAVPELVIIKNRTGTGQNWIVGLQGITGTSKYLVLNSTAGIVSDINYFGSTWTSTKVLVDGNQNPINQSGYTYVMYLFATLAGISKVGSYTGNGSSQNIECGFAAGARFILIKCTSTIGDWFVWDTARGIVAANDPHLSLNTTAAEVTTDDSIDPYAAGFAVNQVAATNINVSSATYIFLAIA